MKINIKNIAYNLKNTLFGNSCLVDIAPDNIDADVLAFLTSRQSAYVQKGGNHYLYYFIDLPKYTDVAQNLFAINGVPSSKYRKIKSKNDYQTVLRVKYNMSEKSRQFVDRVLKISPDTVNEKDVMNRINSVYQKIQKLK